MQVAIALTELATASTVAGAFDLIDYGLRGRGSPRSLFAVAPRHEERFGFIPHQTPSSLPRADWIFVPAIELNDHWDSRTDAPLLSWLRHSAATGSVISSVGTGSFLLAEAGLLEGREAVTHASFCDTFARRYPGVRVRTDISWISHRNIHISGTTPWHEMVLAMLASFLGEDVAAEVAQVYALDWQRQIRTTAGAGQASCDPLIDRARQWLSRHFAEHELVERCARHIGLSRRSLNRRFKEVTGITPMTFVLQMRIQASQNLLRFTNHNVETIGQEVGYQDLTTFRKLFRRSTGMAPAAYRKTAR